VRYYTREQALCIAHDADETFKLEAGKVKDLGDWKRA